MAVVYNQQTGQAVRLDGEQWVPTQIARNPDTGQIAAFDGEAWQVVGAAPQQGTPEQPGVLAYTMSAVNKGLANVAGLPGNLEQLTRAGLNLASEKLGGAPTAFGTGAILPTGEDVQGLMQRLGVPFHEAKTPGGKIAQQAVQGATESLATLPVGMLAPAARGAGLGRTAMQAVRAEAPTAALAGAGSGAGGEAAAQASGDNPAWALAGGIGGAMLGGRLGASIPRTGGAVPAGADATARLAQALTARGATPAAAQALARAQMLPVPLPLSRGQMTGSEPQLRFEQLARQGAFGESASDVMRGFGARQQQGLQENIEAIQKQLGGGQVPTLGAGGEAAQGALSNLRAIERTRVSQLYKNARDAGVAFHPDAAGGVAGAMKQALADFHPVDAPSAHKIVDDLIGEIETAAQGGHGVPLATLEARRKQLSNAMRGGAQPSNSAGAAQALRAFDEAIAGVGDDAILSATRDGVDAWKTARDAYRDWAKKFQAGDLVQKLTAEEWRSGSKQLKVAPDQAANTIFGRSSIYGGPDTARDVKRLRDVLGADSPQWGALREEAWMRLANQGLGAVTQTGERQISGTRFANAFDRARREHKAILDVLFTADEQKLMEQFRDVAVRATREPQYSTAASSANLVTNMAREFWRRRGTLPVVGPLLQNVVGSARAMSATSGKPPLAPVPIGTKAAGAAPSLIDMIGSENE